MRRRLLRNLDKMVGRPTALLTLLYDRALRRGRPGWREIQPPQQPRRILVMKMVGLGDTVLMLTPLTALRERFPEASVTALVTPLSAGILAGQPSVDDMIVWNALAWRNLIPSLVRLIRAVRRARFDCVIDFEQYFLTTSVLSYFSGATRRIGFVYGKGPRGSLLTDPVDFVPGRHMVDNFMRLLEPLGLPSRKVDTLAGIRVSSDDEARVSRWLEAHSLGGERVLVGLHAGSGPRAPHRRWGKDKFAEIARRAITDLGADVILTGTAGERDLIREIAAAVGSPHVHDAGGEFEPKQLAALAGRCRLFISNDTGAMHIAAASGVPTVGLFGPNTPGSYAPVGLHNISLYRQTACSPCVEIHKGEVRDCRRAVCMEQIGVEDVWSEILRCDLAKQGP